MAFMFNTRDVSNLLTSRVVSALQALNMPSILVTRAVLNLFPKVIPVSALQALNMPLISVTLDVSKLLISRAVSTLQPPNMPLMFLTLNVSNLLRLSD